MRGDGDASKDDGEDDDTNTSDKRLPLTGHQLSVSLRGTWRAVAQKKVSLPAFAQAVAAHFLLWTGRLLLTSLHLCLLLLERYG